MPKIIALLFIIVSNLIHAQESSKTEGADLIEINGSQYKEIKEIDSLIEFARTLKGTPYVWGGHTEKGLDCTGFVHYCFARFEIQTPYSSKRFTNYGREVNLKEAMVGDIMVFRGTNPSDTRPGHVGIISEITPEKLVFIHSSSSKKHFGVVETSYYESGYPKRFLKVVRAI